MKSITAVIPIDHELVGLYLTHADLRRAVDVYDGGIKGLADLALSSVIDGFSDDDYVQIVGERIFSNLSAYDENPQIEMHNRHEIEKFLMSDYFYYYLFQFFDTMSKIYKQTLGRISIERYKPLDCRCSNATAHVLYLS